MSSSIYNLRISEYDYDLPDSRIAKFPLSKRDQSKLLVYKKGEITSDTFQSLPEYLPPNTLMVFNNTKVIQARLHFRKETGALIEVFLLEPVAPADYEQIFQTKGDCTWFCLIGNQKKWKEGELVHQIESNGAIFDIRVTKTEVAGGAHVRFSWDNSNVSFAEVLELMGELPIPPYLNRETQESDKVTYQTVYSKIKGSVAAPTAGLHFTNEVLAELTRKGVVCEEVTLHVGAGTFKPVKSEEIKGHEMHTEFICVQRRTLEQLLKHGCRAVAVGTTSVRTLESLYYIGVKLMGNPSLPMEQLSVGQWEPYAEDLPQATPDDAIAALVKYLDLHGTNVLHTSTQIMIVPGYKYKIVEMLITNFHQPKSTLLLLVSAFTKGHWRRIYDYALAHDFRFLSYGDSSLLMP